MLFDEPLSNLDAALRSQVRFEIGRLHKQLSPTIIYVTHDQIEAMTLADRIVVMHEGVIQQVGTPAELYQTPANRFVAGFIGSPPMSFFEGGSDGMGGVSIPRLGTLPDVMENGVKTDVIVGVRPDGFEPTDPEIGLFKGRVLLEEYLGRVSYLHLELPNSQTVIVEAAPDSDLGIDDVVGLRPKPGAAHIFGARDQKRVSRHV